MCFCICTGLCTRYELKEEMVDQWSRLIKQYRRIHISINDNVLQWCNLIGKPDVSFPCGVFGTEKNSYGKMKQYINALPLLSDTAKRELLLTYMFHCYLSCYLHVLGRFMEQRCYYDDPEHPSPETFHPYKHTMLHHTFLINHSLDFHDGNPIVNPSLDSNSDASESIQAILITIQRNERIKQQTTVHFIKHVINDIRNTTVVRGFVNMLCTIPEPDRYYWQANEKKHIASHPYIVHLWANAFHLLPTHRFMTFPFTLPVENTKVRYTDATTYQASLGTLATAIEAQRRNIILVGRDDGASAFLATGANEFKRSTLSGPTPAIYERSLIYTKETKNRRTNGKVTMTKRKARIVLDCSSTDVDTDDEDDDEEHVLHAFIRLKKDRLFNLNTNRICGYMFVNRRTTLVPSYPTLDPDGNDDIPSPHDNNDHEQKISPSKRTRNAPKGKTVQHTDLIHVYENGDDNRKYTFDQHRIMSVFGHHLFSYLQPILDTTDLTHENFDNGDYFKLPTNTHAGLGSDELTKYYTFANVLTFFAHVTLDRGKSVHNAVKRLETRILKIKSNDVDNVQHLPSTISRISLCYSFYMYKGFLYTPPAFVFKIPLQAPQYIVNQAAVLESLILNGTALSIDDVLTRPPHADTLDNSYTCADMDNVKRLYRKLVQIKEESTRQLDMLTDGNEHDNTHVPIYLSEVEDMYPLYQLLFLICNDEDSVYATLVQLLCDHGDPHDENSIRHTCECAESERGHTDNDMAAYKEMEKYLFVVIHLILKILCVDDKRYHAQLEQTATSLISEYDNMDTFTLTSMNRQVLNAWIACECIPSRDELITSLFNREFIETYQPILLGEFRQKSPYGSSLMDESFQLTHNKKTSYARKKKNNTHSDDSEQNTINKSDNDNDIQMDNSASSSSSSSVVIRVPPQDMKIRSIIHNLRQTHLTADNLAETDAEFTNDIETLFYAYFKIMIGSSFREKIKAFFLHFFYRRRIIMPDPSYESFVTAKITTAMNTIFQTLTHPQLIQTLSAAESMPLIFQGQDELSRRNRCLLYLMHTLFKVNPSIDIPANVKSTLFQNSYDFYDLQTTKEELEHIVATYIKQGVIIPNHIYSNLIDVIRKEHMVAFNDRDTLKSTPQVMHRITFVYSVVVKYRINDSLFVNMLKSVNSNDTKTSLCYTDCMYVFYDDRVRTGVIQQIMYEYVKGNTLHNLNHIHNNTHNHDIDNTNVEQSRGVDEENNHDNVNHSKDESRYNSNAEAGENYALFTTTRDKILLAYQKYIN